MRVVSLFSGAGGLDLGLEQAGHEVVWGNDIWIDAATTYRRNFGRSLDTRDIRSVVAKSIPDADVVVGGFPCQGFSVANRSRTLEDPRNGLYKEMVRIVRVKQPIYFVAENVKGLASLGGGRALANIVAKFERAGYRVTHGIVNSADYGVPQARMRLLILGTRLGESTLDIPMRTHADPAASDIAGVQPWVSVGEALDGYPEPEENSSIPNHQCSKYKLRFNGHLGHRYVHADRPAPTITARGDDRGGVVVLHHPRNHRRMTARELAAVQAFPDTFVFEGTKTSAYRQIANAVPPLLGLAIGRALHSKTQGAVGSPSAT